jgi:hypothetical protein
MPEHTEDYMSKLHASSAALHLNQPAAGRTLSVSSRRIWAGRIISAFGVLFLVFSGVIKVLQLAPAIESTVQLGYPEQLVFGIGLLELACVAVYVLPRTSRLGAILTTGYLGGAIATHVRAESGLFPIVFPLLIAALLWGGLLLRDPQLWTLLIKPRERAYV